MNFRGSVNIYNYNANFGGFTVSWEVLQSFDRFSEVSMTLPHQWLKLTSKNEFRLNLKNST